MTNSVTLDKGLSLQVAIAPPPKSKTLKDFGPPEDEKLYVNITPAVIGFRYYESITQYFIQGELEILDATNQLDNIFVQFSDNCGIRKYCVVQISFPDPLTSYENNVLELPKPRNTEFLEFADKLTFYVSKVENAVVDGTKKYYKLLLLDKNAIVNAHKTVISAYAGNFNEIIQKVVKDELYSSLDVIADPYEKTTPIRKYLAQNIKISDIIEFACQKSQLISEDIVQKNAKQKDNVANILNNTEIESKSTGYTFYQTYDGFNFKPLYKLINPSTEKLNESLKFRYEYKPLDSTDDIESASYKLYSQQINQSELTSSALESAQAGTTGSVEVKNYDPFLGRFVNIVSPPQNYKSPCDTYEFEADAKPVVYPTQIQIFDYQYYNSCEEASPVKSPSIRKNYDAILEYIRNNSFTALIPGNISLRAGDYIVIDIAGSQAESDDPNAKTNSEVYMIYSLCHRVTGINKVFTDLVLYKVKKDLTVS